jgi:hypothetical protein
MKCRDVKSALTLYASGDLEFEEAARIHAHLGECLECTKALEREREMLGALARLGRDRKTPVKLMEEIKTGVMERLDREPERSLAVYKPPVSWDRAKTVLALAAAVLFAVLLVVVVLPKNRVGPVQTPGEGPGRGPDITRVEPTDTGYPRTGESAPESDPRRRAWERRWREPVEAPGEVRTVSGPF